MNSSMKKLRVISFVAIIIATILLLSSCSLFSFFDKKKALELGYDANEDGKISKAELETYRTYNTESNVKNGWDINHDGFIGSDETFYIQLATSGYDFRETLHEGHDCEFGSSNHEHNH